ncbi:hypothetical protein BU600_08990 [Staphylococcus arlettae]|uniref:hypothetical protein n=1 Tax=Staphylococcus arlettae TaxID=29378 RepID=UPI000D1990BB|nr:hypothetical protein [Staphylococcus arlettae]PTG39228.1 hypothetical protein BUY24_11195 [Staphylococcus cohnii]RIM56633.1 hypothetical protein BU598_12485 [Staphylococcus arlettae]RIM67963.1 hypothetical protein BU600_08990 [Staphylococcus arlettae]
MNKPIKIFNLELNVGTFGGGLIATIVYLLNSNQDIRSLISISLTFAFPIYLLMISRIFESVNCSEKKLVKEINFPKFTKEGLKQYFSNTGIQVLVILFSVVMLSAYNYGFHNINNIFWKFFLGYALNCLTIMSTLFLMMIIFDFLLGLVLMGRIKYREE